VDRALPASENPPRQLRWKLRIDEERQERCSTAWSDWRAA
jgi:hypothetical protein